YELARDGDGIEIKIFVNAPYDKYVNPGTRFWNASGIDASIGAGGIEVRTQSLISLLAGGLAFDTPTFASPAEPAPENKVFTLYKDQATAMKQAESISNRYVLYFNESLRGLSVGAPVTLLGLPAGEVTDVGLDLDPATLRIRGRVEVVSFPERLVASLRAKQAAASGALIRSAQQRHAVMERLVEKRGLRAQLRSGNLLTGQLYVAFDFFPNAPKVKTDWSADVPELPVARSTGADIEGKITAIVAKLDKLPLEAISEDLTNLLASLDQTLKTATKAVNRIDTDVTPGLKTTIEEIRRVITSADGVLKSADATLVGRDAPAQQELRDALREITRAARSLRNLTDYLERHPEALLRGKTEENQ
ncbi:MAG: MlaD family protein, partial [Deltaproteobacteria bacterium]|nr:MlaD family protein [Deltaproteobacteria bacterium]